jgi:hypothetical protein
MKNILYIISLLLLVSCSTDTYHKTDKLVLRRFLSQPSSIAGDSNGERVGLQPADMSSWEDNEKWVKEVSGLTWNDDSPKRLVGIEWGELELSGKLDLSYPPQSPILTFIDKLLPFLSLNDDNSMLEKLICSGNRLDLLNVSSSPELKVLDCNNNEYIAFLDISGNPELKELYCGTNELTALSLTVHPSLKTLKCDENELTLLDISGAPRLKYLYCNHNELPALDVSRNPQLEELICNVNRLTSLDLSGCTQLQELNCSSNKLTSLDVSRCTQLEIFRCGFNRLTSLDISGCTQLRKLNCVSNSLPSLDVSHCTQLEKFYYNTNDRSAYIDLINMRK